MTTVPETNEANPEVLQSEPIAPVLTAETVVPVAPVASPLALPPATPFYKNKNMLIALVVALALLLGAVYYAYVMPMTGSSIAIVNGKKITQKELDESVSLIEQAATAQGADITKDDVKKGIHDQALEVLINNALLITAALDEKMTASDEEVKAKYDELIAQVGSEEELKKRMAEVGLSEEKLKSNITERILADKYIALKTDVENLTVTDAEVNDFIKNINIGDAKLPPLEEIQAQIKAQILSQKRQSLIVDLLKILREKAEVKITL